MARGKSIPPLIRRIILEQHTNGVSLTEIGRELNLNRQTIHMVVKRDGEKADG